MCEIEAGLVISIPVAWYFKGMKSTRICFCIYFFRLKPRSIYMITSSPVKTCLFSAACAGWSMSCILLNRGVRFKAGTAGYSPLWLCPCREVKTGPDRTMAQLERSWFYNTRVAVPWTLLWPLTQQPGDHCFSVIRRCCGLFGCCSSPFKAREEVIFTAWRIEGKATYCLLLPEDITHLIFFCLGWEGEAGWIKSL